MKVSRKEVIKLFASNLLKGLLGFAALFIAFLLAKKFIPADMAEVLESLRDQKLLVYSIFLGSEIILGLIPPELFMIWGLGSGLAYFIQVVLILAILSYIGGTIAFYLGRALYNSHWMDKIKKFESFQEYSNYYQRFGGILIFISAVTPLPFALFSFISGSLDYTFKRYITYAAFRFIRFAFYGYLVWEGASLTF